MGEDSAKTEHRMNARTWVKIGEHLDRDTLKQAAEKIRARWAGRYDFDICKCPDARKGFELRLRHR